MLHVCLWSLKNKTAGSLPDSPGEQEGSPGVTCQGSDHDLQHRPRLGDILIPQGTSSPTAQTPGWPPIPVPGAPPPSPFHPRLAPSQLRNRPALEDREGSSLGPGLSWEEALVLPRSL